MVMAAGRVSSHSPAPDLAEAREALATEWRGANPQTPDEIAAFYRSARTYGPDLAAWHATPERQAITAMLVHVATQAPATRIVDIGCGAGHDLRALRAALPAAELSGVEPNVLLHGALAHDGFDMYYRVDNPGAMQWQCPIESADLLVCIDVLEHLPDPERFLSGIAYGAPIGCLLFEMTATGDAGTPLHLAANRGWHPGRCLERHGWALVDYSDRVRVWRREELAGATRASLLLCAYRSVDAQHLTSTLALCAGETGWRLRVKTGDALIARSRAIVVTAWHRETADDVFLMVDDDIAFSPADAERIADQCRNGHDIICGAYPVHDGGHLACRFLPGTGEVHFGPDAPPLEIEYAATGFMAVHRRVIDALVASLPLCHADQPWSFCPLFQTMLIPHPTAGHEWISEDWGFCHMARAAGFRVWLDPQTRLTHMGSAGISVANMAAMHTAIHAR